MTKPRTLTISGPFDARHVGGVGIPGATNPVAGLQRASTTSGLQPDETPSHTFVASGNTEVPKRSNTIASTFRQPSLRLKTSLSLLKGRSSSHSPDRHREQERGSTPEPRVRQLHSEMPIQSLRKKPSTSRLWARRMSHDTQAKDKDNMLQHTEATSKAKKAIPLQPTPPPPPPPPTVPAPVETSMPALARKPSTIARKSASNPPTVPGQQHKSPYAYNPAPISAPAPPPPPQKELPSVRPKRADSGMAMDFHDVPAPERPLGFKEIISVSSFDERMKLYKRTRDYWANADHGLNHWVGRSESRRPIVARG